MDSRKSNITKADATAIRERLRLWVNERHSTQEAFASAVGIQRPTVTGWLGRRQGAPQVSHLLVIARKDRLSLNWLLLGHGPDLLTDEAAHREEAPRLYALLAAELGREEMYQGEVEEFLGKRYPVDSLIPRLGKLLLPKLKAWRRKKALRFWRLQYHRHRQATGKPINTSHLEHFGLSADRMMQLMVREMHLTRRSRGQSPRRRGRRR